MPRSVSIDANSQPMAPPPITTADAGSRSNESTSSEVSTIVPSISKPGMVRGTEPDARMTESPMSSTSPAVAADLDRPWSGQRVPPAVDHGDLALLQQRLASPPTSWSTTFCLRAWLWAKSTEG